MSRFSLSEYFTSVTRAPSHKIPVAFLRTRGGFTTPERFIERMESSFPVGAPSPRVNTQPELQRPEDALRADSEALDMRWQEEIRAWIAQKRVNSPESLARALAARQATAEVVIRIESRAVTTPAARALRADAARWRRYGVSLEEQEAA